MSSKPIPIPVSSPSNEFVSGPFHPVQTPPPDGRVFPVLPVSPLSPTIADPEKDPRRSPPTAVAMSLSPLPFPPSASAINQDIKLVLHRRPETVYCPSCHRNVATNLRGRRVALICMVTLLLLLLLICFYLMDEFEHERSIILIGSISAMLIIAVVGVIVFRLSYYHVCPMCDRKLGNIGDIVSKQVININ